MDNKGYLEELDPVAFMNFLRSITCLEDIRLEDASIEDDGREWRQITVTVNGYIYKVTISMDWLEAIGSVIYYKNCAEAYLALAYVCFERMTDWLEYTYEEWVKNDTGRSLSAQFGSLLVKEIERIQNILTPNKD